MLGVIASAGWMLAQIPEPWRKTIATHARDLVHSAFAPVPEEPPSPQHSQVEPTLPLPEKEIAPVKGADAGTLVRQEPPAPQTDATSQAEAADPPVEAAPEPLPPPVADPTDPLQRRALAIGLHPDILRATLERFSQSDWRNAARAIATALASGKRDQTVIWPQTATAKLAQFEVRFVTAAAENCRRYVVTVTRDRWSTTARAMEVCGDALDKYRKSAKTH